MLRNACKYIMLQICLVELWANPLDNRLVSFCTLLIVVYLFLLNRKLIGEWLSTRNSFNRYMELYFNQSKSAPGSSFAGKMLIKGLGSESNPSNERGQTLYAAASTELFGELYILALAVFPAWLLLFFCI